jgi:hypothetical protein
MNGRESDDAVGPDELEREIDQALAVQPSPEFVARVRARVAGDSAHGAWRRPWMWLGVATSAIGLATALVFMRSEPLRLPVLRELPRTHVMAPVDLPSVRELPKPAVREKPAKESAPHVATAAAKTESGPEILIASDEAAALKRLIRGLRHGEVDPSTLPQTGRQLAGPPPEIVVSPIPKISPTAIEPLGLDGGARQ